MPVMKTLGNQIKAARQRQHLSQSALARRVGCKQSALSMYEGGRHTALNASVIGKICDVLGLLPPTPSELTAQPAPAECVRTFCPNTACPGNLPLALGERVVLVPKTHFANVGEHHCAWCGEVLESACPECGAPIQAGAFCVHCGVPYIADTPQMVDPVRVATAERLMAWSH